MKFFEEFKAFINRGNTVDLAVGVVIGTAFGNIIASLVKDIIMPPLSFLLSGVNFTEFIWVLKPATEKSTAIAIAYGNFLQASINFVLISISIFTIIKLLKQMRKQEAKKPIQDPPEEIRLLREIRDSLQK